MDRNLSDDELAKVSEMIASRMGLHFPVEKRATLSRNLVLAARAFGFKNINSFTQWLLSASLNKEEIETLAAHLTISETYFWREPKVFTALTDFVLPELINSKKGKEKSIRIWCAGCSTGEEAYSIAIALHRTIFEIRDWKITILATDINTKALVKANAGIYGSASFRNSPTWLKSNYFTNINTKEYLIVPEIKRMVTFTGYNLTHENFLNSVCGNHKSDIIFCRNVLMYFTSEWMVKVSQNLFSSLSEEGWLVVSSCELSSNLFPDLTPVNFPGAILYRKGKVGFSSPVNSSPYFHNHLLLNTLPASPIAVKIIEQSLNADSKPAVLCKYNIGEIKTHPLTEPPLLNTSENLFHLGTGKDSLGNTITAIRKLADKGYLAEALSSCNDSIISHKLIPGLYLLRASILQELDMGDEAIKSLKQAIYIDPDYIMGHFTLGNLFSRQGNIKYAKRYFKNALELLNNIPRDNNISDSEGLSADYIKETILISIKTQKFI